MCFFLVYLTMQDEFHLGKEGVGGVQQFQPGLCMKQGTFTDLWLPSSCTMVPRIWQILLSEFARGWAFCLFVCSFCLSFSLQLFQVTGRKHTAVIPQGTAQETAASMSMSTSPTTSQDADMLQLA